MPHNSTASGRESNHRLPESPDEAAIETFGRLVRATRDGRLRDGMAASKDLRSSGWSAVPIRPKPKAVAR